MRTEQEKKTMAKLYTQGKTLQNIGDQFSCSRENIRQILSSRGVVMRPPHIKSNAQKEIVQHLFFDKEFSMIEITRELNASYPSVRKHLPKDAGITFRYKRKLNKLKDTLCSEYNSGVGIVALAKNHKLCRYRLKKFLISEGVEIKYRRS